MFMGSGTTGVAAALEGFSFIGIEQDAEYFAIAEARIAHHADEGEVVSTVSEVKPLPTKPKLQAAMF
jgi:DNA modification methylase